MANSKRKCTGCKKRFPADLGGSLDMGLNFFHDQDCAWNHHNKLRDKAAKAERIERNKVRRKITKDNAAAKRRLNDNDKSFQTKKTQAIFNKYIRLRDHDKHCVSCGRHHAGQYHAGHYLSVGAAPELRFDPRNCYKQCSPCNNHLSGNLVNYRVRLIDAYGVGLVNYLEGPHRPKRYTIDNLKTIQRWFKRKTERLEQ